MSGAPGPASATALVPAPAPPTTTGTVEHRSGIIPTLQNVVATVNLGCPLDLKKIALHARNAEYNPKRFAAVIMRIREPKTTALIFASGKMVCTGAKSETDSRLAARKYARIIHKLGFEQAEFKDFKIQNIVGSCDVKFPIRLEGLNMSHGYFATYEPELFPGLIYRMKQPKIVLLIFVSGKVVLTGAKRRDEIYQAFENIYPTLMEFRKRAANEGVLGELAAAAAAAAAAGAGGPPALPGAGPGGAMGPPAARLMPPPPARAPAMMMPPPSPAHPSSSSSSQMPPPTPSHPSQMPPPTPMHAPAATPAFMPPATPHHMPPATPQHFGLDGTASWQPPADAAGSSGPAFKVPSIPPAHR